MIETGQSAQGSPISLDRVAAVERADVFKAGALAGHLVRSEGGVEYSYTPEWVAARGLPVASTLPVGQKRVWRPSGAVPAFFAGLLPEGRRLQVLQNSVKTSADDELSLLLAVGEDTVGDVQVMPHGHRMAPSLVTTKVMTEDDGSFSDLLRLTDEHPDRAALAGVQPKLSHAMINLPILSGGVPAILKLNPPGKLRTVVENEDFFLRAAKESGLRVVEAELIADRDGDKALWVKRFDRVMVGETMTSLAVEDGCQALGRYPAEKYRLTTEEVIQRLASLCEAPVVAALEFYTQIVFAYLTANGDVHAKNLSIVRDLTGMWHPSPAYDLPSTWFYGDVTMALTIDGGNDGNLTGARFLALADAIGVREAAARKVLKRMSASADAWLARIDELPFPGDRLHKFRRVVENRRKRLAQF